MSFGKDDSHLNNIPGFGGATFDQQTASVGNRPMRKGSKMPYWRNNFDLSENPAMPDIFRILRGNYRQQVLDRAGNLQERDLSFVAFREHYHGSLKKGAICSGGPYYMDREKRQPCEGCDIYWADHMERQAKKNRGDNTKGPNHISMMDKFGFTVWDYGYYFEIPQVDQHGQFRMNPRTNQPYTDWVKAPNPQDPQFAGKNWKQGDLRPWAIGRMWKDTLTSWNVSIGLCCVNCGARNSIQSRGWYCGNPQCRQLIFDPNNTTLSADQQAEITRNEYQCNHCGTCALPHEEVACSNCARGERASIFDVDLYGFRQRTGDGKQKQLIITGYSEPRDVQVEDPEVRKTIKPMDLLKHYAPTPIDVQRTLWNISASPATSNPALQGRPQAQWAPPPGAPSPREPIPAIMPPTPYGMPPVAPTPPISPNDINEQLRALSRSVKQ